MKRKIIMLLLVLVALASVVAVSAADNQTDEISANATEPVAVPDEVEPVSVQDEPCLATGEAIDNRTPTSIVSSDAVGYSTFDSTVTAKLMSNGKALSNKAVKITLNGVTYTRNTDSSGKVTLNVKLSKGTYTVRFFYGGDDTTSPVEKTSKLTVKDAIKTKLKLGDKYINYRQGLKSLFYVKLLDSSSKAIKNQWVTFKVSGKTYKAKTNKNGIAKVFLSLKKGKRTVKYTFQKTSPYLGSSGSFKITVKPKMKRGDGYWVWPEHMKSLNLKKLSKRGTKHILLHSYAVVAYGKASVVSFIKRAHKYGMKVHLWIQVCYDGKWVSPMKKDSTLKYGFINKKVREAKRYAKIKGVDGIHFDYVRFGGTATRYKNAEKSINYFCKKAATAIHKVRPNCILSGALMPETNALIRDYGQDVPTMSKYLDALIPMVYKGNYHKTRAWITSVTKTLVKQSNGAKVWTGLQTYHADNNVKRLSHSSLLKDAKAAKKGGAGGVILFRIGISCYLNFKKI